MFYRPNFERDTPAAPAFPTLGLFCVGLLQPATKKSTQRRIEMVVNLLLNRKNLKSFSSHCVPANGYELASSASLMKD